MVRRRDSEVTLVEGDSVQGSSSGQVRRLLQEIIAGSGLGGDQNHPRLFIPRRRPGLAVQSDIDVAVYELPF